MHVSVQKFTSTTCPRKSAGPSGSALSHPVAPPNEGTCTLMVLTTLSRRVAIEQVLGPDVAAEGDRDRPGDREHGAVADRRAEQQPADRLHDRRERLFFGEPAHRGRH